VLCVDLNIAITFCTVFSKLNKSFTRTLRGTTRALRVVPFLQREARPSVVIGFDRRRYGPFIIYRFTPFIYYVQLHTNTCSYNTQDIALVSPLNRPLCRGFTHEYAGIPYTYRSAQKAHIFSAPVVRSKTLHWHLLYAYSQSRTTNKQDYIDHELSSLQPWLSTVNREKCPKPSASFIHVSAVCFFFQLSSSIDSLLPASDYFGRSQLGPRNFGQRGWHSPLKYESHRNKKFYYTAYELMAVLSGWSRRTRYILFYPVNCQRSKVNLALVHAHAHIGLARSTRSKSHEAKPVKYLYSTKVNKLK
jgi:hypothetical protein